MQPTSAPIMTPCLVKSLRHPQRQHILPGCLHAYVVGDDSDPTCEELTNFPLFTYCYSLSCEEATQDDCWLKVMDAESHAIKKNNTCELTNFPNSKKPIGIKQVYKTKYQTNGEVNRFKARLVEKGYKQKPCIDYFDVYALVARLDIVRMIISLTTQNNQKHFQMDVKLNFLNGELEKEVYVEQPQGYMIKGKEENVYKLKKKKPYMD